VAATCVEEAKNGAEQESKGLCHAGLLSQFANGTQCRILLKSQADRVLANDRRLLARIYSRIHQIAFSLLFAINSSSSC
jgi:hypothetical protein